MRDGKIAAIGAVVDGPHARIIDAQGHFLLPGFIQTHIHLCQTLFRGYADDRPLMDWLRQRVWPHGSGAHAATRSAAAARLATTELLMTGTTAILTMETVHDTDAVFEAVGRERHPRDRRQVHDGRDRIGAVAPAGADPRVDRREPRASSGVARARQRPRARGVRAAVRGLVLARVARSGREPVGGPPDPRAHARVGIARRDRARAGNLGRPRQHRRTWRASS